MKSISTILFFALLIYVLAQRLPGLILAQGKQGTKIESALTIQTLQGPVVKFPLKEKKALVFWATWCGPCDVELSRIDRLIKDKKINGNDVIAIAGDEDIELVRKTILERGYQFLTAMDPGGKLATFFEIQATPSIVLVDETSTISWFTMGLSPTLELRLKYFF